MLDDIRAKHRRTWLWFVVRGVLALGVGVLILARPLGSLDAIAPVVGGWAMLGGAIELVHALQFKRVLQCWPAQAVARVLSIAFGLAALYYYPALSLEFISAWLGFWLATAGLMTAYTSSRIRSEGFPSGWLFAWAITCMVAAVFAIVDAPGTVLALLALLASVALVSGATLRVAEWRPRSVAHRLATLAHAPSGGSGGR